LTPHARQRDLLDLVTELFPNRDRSVVASDEFPAPLGSSMAANLSRRRWIGAAIGISFAAAAAALWVPRSSIQKSKWRTLSAVDAKLLFPADDPEATFKLREDRRLEIRSNDISLLRLGQPLLGTFSLNVILHPRQCKSCGVFFRGQRAGQQLTFQTIEFDHDRSSDTQPAQMVWSRWTVSLSDQGQQQATREVLATIAIAPTTNALRDQLQITCGRRSMPEVRRNGGPLPHASWQLSDAGRQLQATPFAQLPTAFLGDLGLVNIGGSCVFEQPRLAYR